MKKENPDLAFGEVGKRLGELWKEVSASEKAKFEEMAKKDKVRTCDSAACMHALLCPACLMHVSLFSTQSGMHWHRRLVVNHNESKHP